MHKYHPTYFSRLFFKVTSYLFKKNCMQELDGSFGFHVLGVILEKFFFNNNAKIMNEGVN